MWFLDAIYQWLNQWEVAGYPLGYVAVCESLHFLFSASAGLSAFVLMRTTFYSAGGNSTILRWSSLLVGLSSALLVHIAVDSWGGF
jgi:hypothetical protein